MQLMTSNWQLHGQLARTARGTERRGAVAVLLARPAAGCTPRCVAGGFAQTAPSLGSGRAETGGAGRQQLQSPRGPILGHPTCKERLWVPHSAAYLLCKQRSQIPPHPPPRDPQARQFGMREESPTACLRQLCPTAPALRYSRSTPRAKRLH